MEDKYPVLKCTKELWDEIKPVLEGWGINKFRCTDAWNIFPYLVSNYGYYRDDKLDIDASRRHNTDHEDSLRYLVNTKDEFLEGVAKLLGKEYKKPKKQFKKKQRNNMERINVAEKLKNCPKGFKLYSKIHGNVELEDISSNPLDYIYVTAHNSVGDTIVDTLNIFDKFGVYESGYPDAECLLFPSKEQQDWDKFNYLEEGHRVMVSDLGNSWSLRCYVKNNIAKMPNDECGIAWGYIVPIEDFDFQAEDLKDNIKKSII